MASLAAAVDTPESEASLYIPEQDRAFWSQRTSETLTALMRNAGSYTDEQAASHLRLLNDVVVPSFGPQPGPGAPTLPLLTSNNSPFEPSWNITDRGASAIRFSFEPMGRNGGGTQDPFAQDMVAAILPAVASRAHGIDLSWFEHFQKTLFLTKSEEAAALAHLPPGVRAPTSFLAFDLDGSRAVFKAYFFPILKHVATGASCEDVAFSSIRSLPQAAPLLPAAARLEAYLAKGASVPVPLEMIAIDCIDPAAGARVKVYGRTESNAFDVVREVATLAGGVVDAVTLEGLDILQGVWGLLHNRPGVASSENTPPKIWDTRHKGICYGFELKPGCEWPETKVYVPVWQYADSDAIIAKNLAAVFRGRGWAVAEKYEDAVPECFPRSDTKTTTGSHSYVSFAFSGKKGVYMTMYYSISPQESVVAL
ncbi:aromatic prenyltransferase [Plectosphaerella plurivora]|uniref:Aromatic prenyltransferase n=1 Tax=Plectosphaerella plurivora TaxID=936078 RepID=A0A9P8VNF3_9PEZI|nr:aromatic prenyltransferase [Plectosphaerella plurivora]